MENKEITREYLDKVKSKITSRREFKLDVDDFIEIHKNLIGKSCKNDSGIIEDCGIEYIRYLYAIGMGPLGIEYNDNIFYFKNSKYLSDYFKKCIRELIVDEDLDDKIIHLLDSDIKIVDMSYEDLSQIYSLLKKYRSVPGTINVNIADLFMIYFYNLNGHGEAYYSFLDENFSDIKESAVQFEESEAYYSRALSLVDTYDHKGRIGVHQHLVGKTYTDDEGWIIDYGVKYVTNYFDCEWGRLNVYKYSTDEMEFIRSKYLSDYFKTSILSAIELFKDDYLIDEYNMLVSILSSNKMISEMSEEEIKVIKMSIDKYYNNPRRPKKTSVMGYFITYLYKLEGKGVSAYIKNNIDNDDIAHHIIERSGLNYRSSFYSGRGINCGDMDTDKLVAIFNKLLAIDSEYALSFVEMVLHMKTLGATEFIESFKRLAARGFKFESLCVSDSNVSLDGAYGEDRHTVAMASIFSIIGSNTNQEYEVIGAESLKRSFIYQISNVLAEINSEFKEKEEYRQYFGASDPFLRKCRYRGRGRKY